MSGPVLVLLGLEPAALAGAGAPADLRRQGLGFGGV